MKKFSTVLVEHKNQFHWCIFEHATEQVVRSFFFEDDAQAYMRFLTDGGAFDGFTPPFVLDEVEYLPGKNVNVAFEHRM